MIFLPIINSIDSLDINFVSYQPYQGNVVYYLFGLFLFLIKNKILIKIDIDGSVDSRDILARQGCQEALK